MTVLTIMKNTILKIQSTQDCHVKDDVTMARARLLAHGLLLGSW